MIAASGEVAWGIIALGQAIGNIGAVVVSYGWGLFGPSRVARNSATERRTEYIESLAVKALLILPVTAVAALISYVLASSTPQFAIAGAIYATSVGLSAGWYFVGLAKPYTMFTLETLPRAIGTAIGVLLMYSGHSAILGPVAMCVGTLVGVGLSTIWILSETKRNGSEFRPLRPLRTILLSNRHGIASTLGWVAYNTTPLAIVSIVAPNIQPVFALADKVKMQIFFAASPAATVLQGWVPRGTESARVRRANIALFSAFAFALSLGVGMLLSAQFISNWLGNGQVSLSHAVAMLMSACITATFFQSVLERAVLATFQRLRIITIAIAAGSIVGLPLVAAGSLHFGAAGALGGMLIGSLVCITIEFVEYVRVAGQRSVAVAESPEYA